MSLRAARSGDAALLAAMHEAAFDNPWGEAEIAALLDGPGGFALIAEDEGPAAFILCRAVGGEAEILTLAVEPDRRRRGLARRLVEAAVKAAADKGAEAVFLEVAEDNEAALGLYRQARFVWAGRRRGYYRRGADAVDALVMRRRLNTGR